jgi:hypothetical protein
VLRWIRAEYSQSQEGGMRSQAGAQNPTDEGPGIQACARQAHESRDGNDEQGDHMSSEVNDVLHDCRAAEEAALRAIQKGSLLSETMVDAGYPEV